MTTLVKWLIALHGSWGRIHTNIVLRWWQILIYCLGLYIWILLTWNASIIILCLRTSDIAFIIFHLIVKHILLTNHLILGCLHLDWLFVKFLPGRTLRHVWHSAHLSTFGAATFAHLMQLCMHIEFLLRDSLHCLLIMFPIIIAILVFIDGILIIWLGRCLYEIMVVHLINMAMAMVQILLFSDLDRLNE